MAYDAYPYVGLWGYGSREIDSAWTPIHPGDTVVFSAWIWTDASTIGDSEYGHSANIGIDAYGSVGRITQINNKDGIGTPTYSNGVFDYTWVHVPWGSGAWVHVSETWIVPNTLQTDGASAYSNSAGYTVVPCAIIAWIGSGAPDHAPIEGAAIYVRDIELCINP